MRISRAPRALTAGFLAVAALLTVSACRVEQGAALFIGDTRYQQEEIDEIVDSVPDETRDRLGNLFQASGGAVGDITTATLRGYVLDALTVVEIGKDTVADADTDASPDRKAADAAEQFWTDPVLGLSADSRFVSLMSQAESYRPALFAGSEPTKPTDEDIESQAAQLEALGRPMDSAQLDQLTAALNSDAGQSALGDKRQVAKLLDEHGVEANPRYGGAYIIVGRDNFYQPVVTAPISS